MKRHARPVLGLDGGEAVEMLACRWALMYARRGQRTVGYVADLAGLLEFEGIELRSGIQDHLLACGEVGQLTGCEGVQVTGQVAISGSACAVVRSLSVGARV